MNGTSEPVPAVDDDLLRDIGYAARDASDSVTTRNAAEHLLASEPMQRLKAAWTAEMAAEYADALRHLDLTYNRVERERDEARALAAASAAEASSATELLIAADLRSADHWQQRALTAEEKAKRLRAVMPTCTARCDNFSGPAEECELHGKSREVLLRERDEARAAVPDLPNVGPVTRDHRGIAFLERHSVIAEQGDQERLRRDVARCLALAAFLDREAEERATADITTDDPWQWGNRRSDGRIVSWVSGESVARQHEKAGRGQAVRRRSFSNWEDA